ncbi:hypothetical protein FB45DRAFT_730108, partial [Roridomyces roridus]
SVRSYADIGCKAVGPRSTSVVSVLFCLELFAVRWLYEELILGNVILVTLSADSRDISRYSPDIHKLLGILLLIFTVFLPLSLLSITSVLGIISTCRCGGPNRRRFQDRAPGSLWHRQLEPSRHGFFGLFMAAYITAWKAPSLAKDRVDPSRFNEIINWVFVVATCSCPLIACAGYLVFGNAISVDLLSTPGYNKMINQTVLWMYLFHRWRLKVLSMGSRSNNFAD